MSGPIDLAKYSANTPSLSLSRKGTANPLDGSPQMTKKSQDIGEPSSCCLRAFRNDLWDRTVRVSSPPGSLTVVCARQHALRFPGAGGGSPVRVGEITAVHGRVGHLPYVLLREQPVPPSGLMVLQDLNGSRTGSSLGFSRGATPSVLRPLIPGQACLCDG